MALTCTKCGWKDKQSQYKYYKSRGLNQPVCVDCNPSLNHRLTKLVVSAFTYRRFGGPPASLLYLPVAFMLAVFTPIFIFEGIIANIAIYILLVIALIANSEIALKVGNRMVCRLIRSQPIYPLVLGYYAPLLLLVLGVALFVLVFR